MAKLKLVAEPTFKSKVGIPVAGAGLVDIEMTFKHRTKAELEVFSKQRTEKSDVETFFDMVVGWELDDPFNAESVELLFQNHIGAPVAIYRRYFDELFKHKLGN